MHVLLVKPKALYIIIRFAEACRRLGFNLTIMTAPQSQTKHHLVSFVDDSLETVDEIPVGNDDADAIAPFLSQYDAVVPGWEYSVIFGERLSAKLGVFHNPLDRLESFRNKYLMRQRFAEAGVSQPKLLARFGSMQEVNEYDWDRIKFPVIVKPADMSASLYVRLCEDIVSAKKVYQRIFKYSQSFSGISFSAQGLLEEVAYGPEYSAECVIQNGKIISLFITTKFVSPYPACDEIGHLSGESFDPSLRDKVTQAVHGVVNAWRIDSAVMHVEYKICNGVVKVIEAACRIGGDMISEIVDLRYNVSLEECLILLRCGLDVTSAFSRYTARGDGYYYAIKYLFRESFEIPTPQAVEIVRRVVTPEAECRSAKGFGVESRLGHVLVRSRSLPELKSYLADIGNNRATPFLPENP